MMVLPSKSDILFYDGVMILLMCPDGTGDGKHVLSTVQDISLFGFSRTWRLARRQSPFLFVLA